MKRTLFAFTAVSMLGLGACGGSPNAHPISSTTTTVAPIAAPTTTTTTVAKVDIAADKAYMQNLVLVPADLPGWKDEGVSEDASNDMLDESAINACINAPADSITLADITGKTFSLGGNLTLTSSATSVKSKEYVDMDFNGFNDPKNLNCVADQFNKTIADSMDGNSTQVTSKLVKNNTGDPDQLALRLTTTVVTFGQPSVFSTDILGMRDGRYELSVQIRSSGQPPSPDVLKQVLSAMRNHVKAARATTTTTSTSTSVVKQASADEDFVPTPR